MIEVFFFFNLMCITLDLLVFCIEVKEKRNFKNAR